MCLYFCSVNKTRLDPTELLVWITQTVIHFFFFLWKSNRFGTSILWVNDEKMFIFGRTTPFNHTHNWVPNNMYITHLSLLHSVVAEILVKMFSVISWLLRTCSYCHSQIHTHVSDHPLLSLTLDSWLPVSINVNSLNTSLTSTSC